MKVFWDRGPFKKQAGLLAEQACKLRHSLAEGGLQLSLVGKYSRHKTDPSNRNTGQT